MNIKILKKLAAFTMAKKEATPGTTREVLQYLYFTGDAIVATDTHWLVVLKDVPSDVHYETTNGETATCEQPYPDYKRVLLSKDRIAWKYTWPKEAQIVPRLKALLTGVARAVKDTDFNSRPTVMLHKSSDTLGMISAYKELQIQTYLVSGQTGEPHFEGYYFLSYWTKALELLEAVGGDLTLSVSKTRKGMPPLITLETPQIIILGAPVDMSNIPYNPIEEYKKKLVEKPEAPADSDDLDFLE